MPQMLTLCLPRLAPLPRRCCFLLCALRVACFPGRWAKALCQHLTLSPPHRLPLPPAQDVQYNQVLQAVLLAQFEMQRRPGEFREEINLPDRIVDRALAAWRQQQQVGRVGAAKARLQAALACAPACIRDALAPGLPASLPHLTPQMCCTQLALLPACRHPQAVKLSAFHLEVSAALAQLGVPFEVEYKTEHSLLSVDIAIIDGGERRLAGRGRAGREGGAAGCQLREQVHSLPQHAAQAAVSVQCRLPAPAAPCPSLLPLHPAPAAAPAAAPDRKIAIEVDGPFHFAVNTNSPLGQTMIRRRLLRACGWIVISVPCHTWWVALVGK